MMPILTVEAVAGKHVGARCLIALAGKHLAPGKERPVRLDWWQRTKRAAESFVLPSPIIPYPALDCRGAASCVACLNATRRLLH